MMNYTEHVLVFSVNGRPIGATVTFPRGPKRSPTVILAGGSLSQGRDGELLDPTLDAPPRYAIRRLAHRLATEGYASIRWDKPGCGSSRWPGVHPRIDDYADVLAGAHQLLSAMPRVDPERILIAGESAGAYYATWLARRGEQMHGYALLGALGSTIERLFEFNYLRTLDYARRSPEHWRWVTAVAPRALAYGLHYQEMFAHAHAGAEHYTLRLDERRWEIYLPTLREQLDNRPLPLFDHLAGPVLVMQGDRDMNVPPGDGDLIAARLRAIGRTQVKQVTVVGGDHNFQAAAEDEETRLRERIALSCLGRPYLDGAYQALLTWLDETCYPERYSAARLTYA